MAACMSCITPGLGKSVAAAALVGRIGSSAVIALGGGAMAVLGLYFAWALKQRAARATRGVHAL